MLDCANVKELSDTELLGNLDLLRVKERKITIDLILHLAELEERKLHLVAGSRLRQGFVVASRQYV